MFSIETNVEFSYDASTLKKSFLESGGNMLTIQADTNGFANIELYNELFPFFENDSELVTDEMWKRMFYTSLSHINKHIRMVVPEGYSSIGVFDINKGSITIPVSLAEYNEADLQVMDSAIYDALVYGAVAEWFTNAGVEALVKMSREKQAESLSNLAFAARKLEATLLRKPQKSAIFDSMI